MKRLFYLFIFSILVWQGQSCQKEIEFDLPDVEQSIVLEGTLESGQPPVIFLTNTQGYFDPIDSSTFNNIFVHDADVVLFNGTDNITLDEITFNGFSVYTSLDPAALGAFETNYKLTVQVGDKELIARTKIPNPLPLDSTWFDAYPAYDSLGFIWARFTDPDTVGNCYRWFAQRINSYRYNYPAPYDDVLGQMKDSRPLAPVGSSTDDKLFNGLTFDFVATRGEDGFLEGPDDEGIEEGFFKRGDTVVIKSTTTTYPSYLYIRAMENAAASNGSIFSSPGNLPYNVEGDGVGILNGYGVSFDTVICE